MGAKVDLKGQKFGRLTVIAETPKRKNGSVVWHCKCDCGNECDIPSISLRKGRTRSCGCLKQESDRNSKNYIDITGQKFGHLTVIEKVESDKYGHTRWKCVCDCPAHTELIVFGDNLRRGHTQSCGCERRSHGELTVENLLKENNVFFEQEYKAFQFSSKKWATFDFYVDKKYFIEYDGETHYQYNLHGWHNEAQLKAQQERDVIKNQWCKDNNIPLIRIPYWHLKDLKIEDLQLETTEFLVKEK